MIIAFVLGVIVAAAAAWVFGYVTRIQRGEYMKAVSRRDADILKLTAQKCYRDGRMAANNAAADSALDYMVECETLKKRLRKLERENAELKRKLEDRRNMIEV